MSHTSRTRSRALAAAALTASLLAGTATLATAAAETAAADLPVTTQEGNDRDSCAGAGLEGEVLAEAAIEGEVSADGRYLTITWVAEGVVVTGVSVKGGPAFNVYEPGAAALPWTDLRSPDNKGGNVPVISHWIACGTMPETSETPESSETPDDSETPGKPESPGNPDKPGEDVPETEAPGDGPATSEEAVVATTTSSKTPAPVVAEDSENLADTGFSSGWLVVLGALLLAGGVAIVALSKLRGSRAGS